MNNVLILGKKAFITGVRSQVEGLREFAVTTAATASDATTAARNSPPDIIIAHALELVDGSISTTFGSSHSAYSIVIERTQLDICEGNQLEKRDRLEKIRLEKTAHALKFGADAYLWILSNKASFKNEMAVSTAASQASCTKPTDTKRHTKKPLHQTQDIDWQFQEHQRHLIWAYIQSGLHKIQHYRNLSKTNDWLSTVALNDSLTQISNRRAFDIALPTQIQVARSQRKQLALGVIDIDFFKQVNDRYGHLVGDEILRSMTRRASNNMRFYDSFFRYGGEEFVILLNNTDIQVGSEVADRIRESIANHPFCINMNYNGRQPMTIALTVSIGISRLKTSDDEQGQSLLDRADRNLLKAKATGRNRVISDVDTWPSTRPSSRQ